MMKFLLKLEEQEPQTCISVCWTIDISVQQLIAQCSFAQILLTIFLNKICWTITIFCFRLFFRLSIRQLCFSWQVKHFDFSHIPPAINIFFMQLTLSDQPVELERFMKFVFVYILTTIVADGIGLIVGSCLNPVVRIRIS